MRDLYDVLEVSSTASQEAVDASYQRLSKKYRDLLNTETANSSEVRFRLDALQHAYSVISDTQKRLEYDRRRFSRDEAESGFLSSLYVFLSKPIVIGLVVFVSVMLLTPVFLKTGVSHDVVEVEKERSEKTLEIVDKVVENDFELENKRLSEEVKLLQVELERKNRELEYQFQLLRQEQERESRELDYRANAGDRVLRMQEREQEQSFKERDAAEKFLDGLMQ